MPFVRSEPWEKSLFSKWEHLVEDVNVPLYDDAAWTICPALRPFMNKLHVAELCGHICGPHGIEPPKSVFPIISKPTYNVYGMGMGVRVFTTPEEYWDNYCPGHFWMSKFEGVHQSTDILVKHRSVIWSATAVGVVNSHYETMFDHWKILKHSPEEILCVVKDFVKQHIPESFCGALNLETIGNNIIEINPRFSTQFCEFYGDTWFNLLADVYKDVESEHATSTSMGYSIPVWCYIIPHTHMIPNHEKIHYTLSECKYFSLPKHRIAYINTTDYEEGKRLHKWINDCISRGLVVNIDQVDV